LAQGAPKPPAETTLASYKLVIITNDNFKSSGNKGGTPDSAFDCMLMYKKYLDIGGMVWMFGLNNFSRTFGTKKWYPATQFTPPIFQEMASNYFHVLQIYSEAWDFGEPGNPKRNENFMGVAPYGAPELELPDCEIDTSKLIYYQDYPDTGTQIMYYNYIPGVNVLALDVAKATRVYSFVSYLGEASEMQGRPVGLVTIGPAGGRKPIYKCAEFCFPLFPLKAQQAEEMMEKMIKRFFMVPLNP